VDDTINGNIEVFMRKEFGKYVISDPLICHGALTFRGTRVMVAAVLEQVAEGKDWDRIVRSWDGTVPREAIAEAIRLAQKALISNRKPRGRAA
jgi:uncharacterized protein (DUF433 family)